MEIISLEDQMPNCYMGLYPSLDQPIIPIW